MNLDRLTELRKKKNWSLQYTADLLGIAKAHMPATSQATDGLHLKRLPCWLTSLTQPAMNF